MAKKTYTSATLYHPSIEGVTHVCSSVQEQDAWEAQGWLPKKPNYGQTGVSVQVVKDPAAARNVQAA
ncbi:hypothetical protein [Rothia sp. CCM 9416]|uniref:hypothetical protein n=1 Tax=Rothia sp. CCM 9416 TaxID=3402655 RepID=UPI003AE51665